MMGCRWKGRESDGRGAAADWTLTESPEPQCPDPMCDMRAGKKPNVRPLRSDQTRQVSGSNDRNSSTLLSVHEC